MPEPNRSSRRQFLAASVATTSVLTAELSLSRGIHAAGSQRSRSERQRFGQADGS